MEIGSIFEINPETVKKPGKNFVYYGRTESESYRYNTMYLSSCREAIYCILSNISDKVNNVCLMPAYMCDTVFDAFTNDGWKIVFYHVDRSLKSDPEEIERLMEKEKPGMLFLHNYYGVETTANLEDVVRKAKELGIVTVMDATQSYYLVNPSYDYDYVVCSLRKWYAIPDGAFLLRKENMISPLQTDGYLTNECLKLRIDKYNYLQKKDAELKQKFMEKHYEMEKYLDDKRHITRMSDETEYIMKNTDEKACEEARRDNASYLYAAISMMKSIEPITYKEGAAPLFFPIYAEERDELKKVLVENDVYTPVLWPIGKENEDILSEDERYIYEHMLAIPVDQRYGIEAMEKIVNIMREFDNR